MGKYQTLDELNDIGISFEKKSKEDALIDTINSFGYNVHMDQSDDGTWKVWVFKHKGVEVIDHASTDHYASRIDALKEAAWMVIDR